MECPCVNLWLDNNDVRWAYHLLLNQLKIKLNKNISHKNSNLKLQYYPKWELTSCEDIEEGSTSNLISLWFNSRSRSSGFTWIRSAFHHHLEGRIHYLLCSKFNNHPIFSSLCWHVRARIGIWSVRIWQNITLNKEKVQIEYPRFAVRTVDPAISLMDLLVLVGPWD